MEKIFKIPIICVGNVYVGGTGKTPLCQYISETLNNKLKKKTTIIKKFYIDQLDEVELLQNNNQKIITDISRISAIKKAIKKKYKAIIMDDGLQDFSIKKNLKILCFTSKQGFGNGFTIPSGPLREPLSSIRSCQIAIINGGKNITLEKKIKKSSPNIKIFYSNYFPANAKNFKKKKLLAFAGIGNPVNFFKMLKNSKLNVKQTIIFPDHYFYSLEDLNKLKKISKKNDLNLITTEKDYYRLRKIGFSKKNVLKIKFKLEQEKKFINEIKRYV